MDISTQISQVIDVLAEKLCVAAEYVYPLLVRQSYVDGFIALLQIVLYVMFLYGLYQGIVYLFFGKNGESKFQEWTDDYIWEPQAVISLIFLIFCGIIFIVSTLSMFHIINVAVTALSNPEWYALQKILLLLE